MIILKTLLKILKMLVISIMMVLLLIWLYVVLGTAIWGP